MRIFSFILLLIVITVHWRTILILTILVSSKVTVLLIASTRTSLVASLLVIAIAFVHLSATSLRLHIFLHKIDNFIRNTKIFDRTSSYIAFVHSPESVAILELNVLILMTHEIPQFLNLLWRCK